MRTSGRNTTTGKEGKHWWGKVAAGSWGKNLSKDLKEKRKQAMHGQRGETCKDFCMEQMQRA